MRREPKPAMRRPEEVVEIWRRLSINRESRRQAILAYFPRVRDEEALVRDMSAVLKWLVLQLQERERLQPRRKRELQTAATRIAAAREAIGALSRDSRRAAEGRARADAGGMEFPWTRVDTADDEILGTIRLLMLSRALADGERWLSDAQLTVFERQEIIGQWNDDRIVEPVAPRGRGRPRDLVAYEAVGRMAEIWKDQTGQRAPMTTHKLTKRKSGAFVNLCSNVLDGVYLSFEAIPPQVDRLVRNLLGERRKAGID